MSIYGKRVLNMRTGETGIVVARESQDCPNVDVAPDRRAERVVCWPKSDVCVIVSH